MHRLPRLGVHTPAEYVKAMAVRLPRGTVDGVAFDRGARRSASAGGWPSRSTRAGGSRAATLAWEAARAMNATGCDRAVLLQLPTLVCKSSAKPRLPALGLEPKRFQIAYGAAT